MKYMAILGHLNGPWDYNKNIINNYNIIKIYTNLIRDNLWNGYMIIEMISVEGEHTTHPRGREVTI